MQEKSCQNTVQIDCPENNNNNNKLLSTYWKQNLDKNSSFYLFTRKYAKERLGKQNKMKTNKKSQTNNITSNKHYN